MGSKTPPEFQEAFLTVGSGWAAVSAGPPQESSSRHAHAMLTNKITYLNMARRITERERKIKAAKREMKFFMLPQAARLSKLKLT
jgi:hypothetical protein